MGKNIVVFSDGTGQDGGKGNNTNVYKLFNMVEDRTDRQIAFYDRGLGTGWRGLVGRATGMGISQNICDCYQFIFENYQAGDQIYLFGFSRGATTVRSLSGMIHLFGILPKSRPELIRKAYKIYKTRDSVKREAKAKHFIDRHHTMWTSIKFLGVWDTVAALGVPIKSISVALDKLPFFRHKFHDLLLSPSVLNAYHALAVDDERKTFHPMIWTGRSEKTEVMEQVWFPGMHSDVGGGYEKHELSDIALKWMIERAERHDLLIYRRDRIPSTLNFDGFMHNSREGFPGTLYRQALRTWDTTTLGQPIIHQSVKYRSQNVNNQPVPTYQPWICELEHKIEGLDQTENS